MLSGKLRKYYEDVNGELRKVWIRRNVNDD